MAATSPTKSQAKKKVVKKVNFVLLQKLAAAVCLLAFVVMLTSGILAGVPVVTITFRACIAMLVVKVVLRILVSVIATYEEMNSGKA